MTSNTQEKNHDLNECLWIKVYRNGITFESDKPPKCISCNGYGNINGELNGLCDKYAATRNNH